MVAVNLKFRNRRELRTWLEDKNWNAGSPEAFNDWLYNFFDEGNSISVRDEEYDYWSCQEML